MIGRLRGRLIEKQPPTLVLDVHGVGYEVQAPMSTIYAVNSSTEEVSLFTHLVVRDDALLLYGFATQDERYLFRELIRVSGIGPKLALAVLSGISVADFVATINAEDSARLTAVPGIGKKTAARLLIEMRDRLKGDELTGDNVVSIAPAQDDSLGEARRALVALGYKPKEAARLLKGVDKQLDSEGMIRAALQKAMP